MERVPGHLGVVIVNRRLPGAFENLSCFLKIDHGDLNLTCDKQIAPPVTNFTYAAADLSDGAMSNPVFLSTA